MRHGTEDGLVSLGGRQVSIRRPRLRSADRTSEVQLPTYQACTSTELLGRETLVRMMAKLSTRRYGAGLEPMGTTVEAASRSTSKSAVSRRFVAATETALAELMASDLSELDLVAIMIDGVHFAGFLCVVALGIDIDGNKWPLAVEEGDTENATLVKDLLAGLRERGLDMTKPILAVLDGAKALCAGGQGGLRPPGDRPVPTAQDSQRRVQAARRRGPGRGEGDARRLRQPRRPGRPGRLEALAKRIERSHPGAAGQPARGTGRDAHRRPPRCATHPGPHAALDERGRVDDRDLP